MRMRGIVLTTVLLLLASPGVAAAATARLEGGTLVFEAGAGEVNDVVVAYFTAASLGSPAEYRIAEVERIYYPQPVVTPLAGCRSHTKDPTHIVACPADGVTAIRIVLGDGPDRVRTLGDYRFLRPQGCHPDLLYSGDNIPAPLTFEGEAGDDELFEGPYMIVGVPRGLHCTFPRTPRAQVTSHGGAGNDLIVNAVSGSGGPGADSLEAPNVTSTQAGDGGNDVLLGGRVRDALDGGPGADILDGGSKADSILGGPGGDLMEGGPGGDSLDGGSGADELNGSEGSDHLTGGPGGDILDGGSGRDRATRDRRDRVVGVERG